MAYTGVLTIERLAQELPEASVRVLRQALSDGGVGSDRPPACEHLSSRSTPVVVAGQASPFIGCARCQSALFPGAMSTALCRACRSKDDVVLIGASADVTARAFVEPVGPTLWLEQVVVLAALCATCRTRREKR